MLAFHDCVSSFLILAYLIRVLSLFLLMLGCPIIKGIFKDLPLALTCQSHVSEA
jgi:hypothetical protein